MNYRSQDADAIGFLAVGVKNVAKGWIGAGVFLVAVLCANKIDALTFYVSPSGNDANSCVTAQRAMPVDAKQTLAGALACVTGGNGDAILYHAGTYATTANFINNVYQTFPSGSSFANALTIGAAGDGPVTILGNGGLSLYNVTLSYVIVQDLIIDADYGNGVGGDAAILYVVDHIRIQRCTLKHSQGFGLGTDASPYDEILNNTITANGTHGQGTTNGHGMYITSLNTLIEGNDVFDNEGYGIHIYDTGNAASHPGIIVRNNWVHGNGLQTGTTYGITVAQASGALVYNNIVYGQTASGAGGIQVYTGSLNTGVYNNTIYNTSGECLALQYYGSAPTVQNNLCSSTGSNIVDHGGTGTPVIDHNLSGFSSSNFTNASGADFTLVSAASMAIDAGVAVAVITTDIAGNARPQGLAFDIGAYEFATVSTPQAPGGLQLRATARRWESGELRNRHLQAGRQEHVVVDAEIQRCGAGAEPDDV
jgi:hypothetical protein